MALPLTQEVLAGLSATREEGKKVKVSADAMLADRMFGDDFVDELETRVAALQSWAVYFRSQLTVPG